VFRALLIFVIFVIFVFFVIFVIFVFSVVEAGVPVSTRPKRFME
jgi:hypothetical protein